MAAVTTPCRMEHTAGLDESEVNDAAGPEPGVIYQPLDTKVDCTRFIRIESAPDDDDPISCELVYYSIRERPIYQALSYRWGDVQETQNITVNGIQFPVGNNLMGALRFLRRLQGQTGSKLVWIDAICINQNDENEKSRQVGLMGQIYSRAANVVVWLGEKYSCYQKDLHPDILAGPPDISKQWSLQAGFATPPVQRFMEILISWGRFNFNPKSPNTKSSPQGDDKDMLQRSIAFNMVNELIDAEYWQRLWIVQELGQASEVQVGFGTWAAPWSQFVSFLRTFVSSGKPLTFDLKLREKTHRRHTLKQLLEDHQDALCSNRRDKIYGLVGLATNATDFPIDYTKSPLEVWIDTMNHMSTNYLLDDNEWIKFGRLVKSLLIDTGGEPATTLQDSAQWPGPLEGQRCAPITIKTSILGPLCEVGPSLGDCISTFDAVKIWKAALRDNYKRAVASVAKESIILLQCILNADDSVLEHMAATHHCPVSSIDNGQMQLALRSCGKLIGSQKIHSHSSVSSDSGPTNVGTTPSSATSSGFDHRLYQLYPLDSEALSPKLGIAPTNAQLGDLICRVPESKRSLVVRQLENRETNLTQVQVVGTATSSDEVAREVAEDAEERERILLFPSPQTFVADSSALLVHIDTWILYQLVSGHGLDDSAESQKLEQEHESEHESEHEKDSFGDAVEQGAVALSPKSSGVRYSAVFLLITSCSFLLPYIVRHLRSNFSAMLYQKSRWSVNS